MDNFWKPFAILFSTGVAVAFAKWLREHSKKPLEEVVGECLISGFVACIAALILLWQPNVPILALVGGGVLLSVLGVNFLSRHVEDAVKKAKDKYLTKDQ